MSAWITGRFSSRPVAGTLSWTHLTVSQTVVQNLDKLIKKISHETSRSRQKVLIILLDLASCFCVLKDLTKHLDGHQRNAHLQCRQRPVHQKSTLLADWSAEVCSERLLDWQVKPTAAQRNTLEEEPQTAWRWSPWLYLGGCKTLTRRLELGLVLVNFSSFLALTSIDHSHAGVVGSIQPGTPFSCPAPVVGDAGPASGHHVEP